MMNYPAIRILQPLGEFYLTALPVNVLLQVCFSHRHTRSVADESGRVEDDGHQRRLDKKRLKDIAHYLETQDATLPGTIIIAANCTEDGNILNTETDLDRRWQVKNNADDNRDIVIIEIPTDQRIAAVVDGQHRLWGFDSVSTELQKMSLPCAIFFDLPTPEQASIFATINFNQKPVSKSQTYELFGYNLDDEPPVSWSPDKLAVFFTRKLNVDGQSPLKDHIKVAAQDDRVLDEIAKERKKEWSVSTATIVEAIIALISSDAKGDRNALHRVPLESRSRRLCLKPNEDKKRMPFRDIYLAEDNDIVIYKTIINYLSAVDELFWQKEMPGIIRKTIGIQALFDVFRELLPEKLLEKNLKKEVWITALRPATEINFINELGNNYSGKGRTQIKKAILERINQ